jgi:hypothetical protein
MYRRRGKRKQKKEDKRKEVKKELMLLFKGSELKTDVAI